MKRLIVASAAIVLLLAIVYTQADGFTFNADVAKSTESYSNDSGNSTDAYEDASGTWTSFLQRIPEPATILLLALSSLIVMRRRRAL